MASTPLSSFSSNNSKSSSKGLYTPAPWKDLLPSTPDPTLDKKPANDLTSEASVIDRIIKLVLDHQRGIIPNKNPKFHLEEQQYDQLLDTLQKADLEEYFDNYIRYQWNADSGELELLLIATPLHEGFLGSLDYELGRQIEQLEQNPAIAPFAEDLKIFRHAEVATEDERLKMSPDGQFRYKESDVPAIVYEVAHNQSEVDVLKTGRTGFEYNASVFLWRADLVDRDGRRILEHKVVQHASFRKQGRALPGSLRIPFKLFIPPHQRYRLPSEARTAFIDINYNELNRWFEKAERQERKRRNKLGCQQAQPASFDAMKFFQEDGQQVLNYDTQLQRQDI
ncbi:hypothetical protein EV127DRAFT_507324 [Xylaria flabelliformis]|nr:hypothetical protein EV127DRAFT_507324 [Xylaria flabelliformis]